MFVSRMLHIFGAIILVGGLFYLRTVVMPSPAATNAVNVDQKFGGLRAKWAMWVGIATALLLVTGIWNHLNTSKRTSWPPKYHMILGMKMLAAIGTVRAGGRSSPAGRSPRKKFAKKCGSGSVSAMALGVLTVALGSVLRTFPHNPKVDAPTPHTSRPRQPAAAITDRPQRLFHSPTNPTTMDKKAQKRIDVFRKKIAELQPRLAGAKKQMDEPDEVRKLEAELAAAQAEIEKLKSL